MSDAKLIDADGSALANFVLTVVGSDFEESVHALVAARHALQRLRDAEAELTAWVAETAPDRHVLVEGVGGLTVTPGTKRDHWDHVAVWDALVQHIATDRHVLADEDGELRPPGQAVAQAVRRASVFCAVAYWRSGGKPGVVGLRDLGLDPDEFCHRTTGPKGVRIG